MIRNPWRLFAVVLVFALVSSTTLAADDLRLGDAVRPDFQRVHLILDPAKVDYSGTAHVDLTVLKATSSFRFHAEEMELTRLELTDEGGQTVPVTFAPIAGARIEVTAERSLSPGVYSLEVGFANDFGTRAVGLYRAEHQGNAYLFTQFQAIDAREAFPVWDEPGVKIPYQLVLTVPAGQVAVSNTPEVARHEAEGSARVTFARTRPLPSYLLALAVGPFEATPIEGMSVPGRVLAPRGLGGLSGEAVAMTPPIVAALEAWFGRPYPYEKLDLLAVPEFWPGAMENPGLITFADDVLLLEPGAASAEQRRSLARITAHEVAHMWFGDLVTMRWWDDLWLNESFADWMGIRIADRLYPELELDLSMLRGVQQIFGVDARPTTEAIRQPVVRAEDSIRSVGLAYAKGRAVLGMVEQWLGEETFRRGIRAYVDRHADGNTVAADLWRALAEASGEDVQAVLASFLEQPGHPLVTVTPEAGGAVRLEQRRFLNHGVEAPAQRWRVPVVLRYSQGGEVKTRALLLDGPSARVELGADVEWVMPNAGAHGYYRWQLPEPALLELAAAAPEVLEPAERIGLLGNTAALLDAGALGGDAYLRVLEAFAHDPHPDVVSALISNLGKVEQAFVPDELRAPFSLYVRRTLGPALERFGMEPRAGEPEAVALFRPQLLGWLGDEGEDPQVLAYAARLAEGYLAEPHIAGPHIADPAAVDPALAGVALGLAAKHAGAERFDLYRQRFESSTSPGQRELFLEALGAFDDPSVQARALAYTLEGPVRPTELFTIPVGVADSPGGDDRMYSWVVEHFADLTSRMPPEFVAFMPFIATGCSAERLAEARAFFAQPAHRVEGTEVQLAKVAEQVEDCVSLRRREGAAVAAYLLQSLEGAP